MPEPRKEAPKRASTGSWDLDVSLQILDASFADFARRSAEPKREPAPKEMVRRQVLHGRSEATQTSHGARWNSHPMPYSAAAYYLRMKELRPTEGSSYWLEDVVVEKPDERFFIEWVTTYEDGTTARGEWPPMSKAAAEYCLSDIPASSRVRTKHTIKEIPRAQ